MGTLRHDDRHPVDLAVIIPSYNSADTLPQSLDALVAQIPPPHEIIVVDSSPDFPLEFYRRRHPQVRFIHLTGRAFAGKARNIGAAASSAPAIAFLDADCIVTPGWTSAVMEALRQHPEQSAFTGVLRNANPAHIFGWLSFLSEFSGYVGRFKRRRVACLPSYCLVIRRETFLASGGFPEDLATGQDAVFTRRLAVRGVALFLEPSVSVAHLNRSRFCEFLRHQYRLGYGFGRNRTLLPDMPGSRWVRRSTGFLPLMAIWRSMLTAARLLRDYPEGFVLLLLLSPLYIIGCLCWLAGAVAGRSAAKRPTRRKC